MCSEIDLLSGFEKWLTENGKPTGMNQRGFFITDGSPYFEYNLDTKAYCGPGEIYMAEKLLECTGARPYIAVNNERFIKYYAFLSGDLRRLTDDVIERIKEILKPID